MSLVIRDGGYDQPGGVEIGAPIIERPFEKNGDVNTLVITRAYKQTPASFIDDRSAGSWKLGAVSDAEFQDAWLIAQSTPTLTPTGLYLFTRTFARIPLQQSVPGSMFVTKPDIPGEFPQVFGSRLIIKPDSTVASYDAYTSAAISSDGGVNSLPTAGTYTLTFGGDTTSSLAYDASASSVQTALNALASITARGGCTVSGSYSSGFTVTFNSHAAGSITTSSLTGGTITSQATSSLNGYHTNFTAQAASGGNSVSISGGTFTLTFFGQTTAAIAYNATLTDVANALNALSNVSARGGVTVQPWFQSAASSSILVSVGGVDTIIFNVSFTNAAITGNGTSLVPATTTITATRTPSYVSPGYNVQGHVQVITFVSQADRILYAPGHGISTGDTILVVVGGTYYSGISSGYTVQSTDTVLMSPSAGSAYSAAGTATLIGRRVTAGYAPGAALTRIKRVTDFYLPGISPGISTADDIPLPAFQGDSQTLLSAILAGTTSINYEVGELSQWRDSPILARTITTLNAATL